MIYSVSSTPLTECYKTNGENASVAYELNGDVAFRVLKIMSYNLQRWEGYNSMKTVQDIAFGYGADIIGIQEWGYTASKTIGGTNCADYIEGFGYDNLYITSSDYNHKAIASKFAMSDMTETVYEESIETRSYTKSYFTFDGKTIAFFNTHTDYQKDSSVKFAQLQELLDAVAEESYFILTGDLNTDCSAKTDTEYQNGPQIFIDSGFNVANSPTGEPLIWTGYSGKTVALSDHITPADNIITSANIKIVNVNTIDTKLTIGTNVIDHIPIVAEVVIL